MVLQVISQTISVTGQLVKNAASQTLPQTLHFSKTSGVLCVGSIEQHRSVNLREEGKPQTPIPSPVHRSHVLTKLGWIEFTFKNV